MIGIPDEKKPFSKSKNASYDSQHPKVPHLVAITVQELQIEGEKIEEERKARQSMWDERINAYIEASVAGLTVEEYEVKRAEERRKAEEARSERQRKIQAEKDEKARRGGYFGARR